MLKLSIFILFLGSGITGLIYQVLWTKLLALTFGVTFLAVSTVLTTFFGGLALGSFLGGRWIDRHGLGLKWYGLAEIGIGLFSLFFTLFLDIHNAAYVFIAQKLPVGFLGLSLLKFFLASILLIIPTTLMGTTLPILSKTLVHSSLSFAKDIGGLYAINTVGAVIGTLFTTFYFIPVIGVDNTLYVVGVVNIILGLVAVYLNNSFAEDPVLKEQAPIANEVNVKGEPVISDGFFKYVVWLFALSGYTALVYEVIWTRVLGFILTGTIFAFTIVLATFLCGIALGSFMVSRFLDRVKSLGTVVNILGVVEILIGMAALGIIFVFDKMPNFNFYTRLDQTPVWSEFIYLNFLTCFVILFLPALLFGTTFPLVCKIYGRKKVEVGKTIGDIYSVNTVGGIVGSFTAGFVLIPFMGMHNSLLLMSALNIGLGATLLFCNPYLIKVKRIGAVLIALTITITIFIFLPDNMPKSLHKSFLTFNEKILYYNEGPTSTVMIAQREGRDYITSNKRLWVNGNMATAAFYEGLQINRFQGVLPMVLHPDPKDVLVVCFGSGTTFGTLSQFDVRQVDNVELSKTVIQGAHFFKKENRDVLNNPVSNIIIDDGRSYLEVATKKYDVMTMEPMHPLLAGVVNLYTKEYYELLKSHLKKEGLVSQWIPLYNLSTEDVRMMAKTFQSVFPHTSIWFAAEDIFMIGSLEKLEIDYDRLIKRISVPRIHNLLRDIDLEDPLEFLNTFIMNEDQVRMYTEGADVLTDSKPVIEYTGPRSLNVNTISPNLGEMLKYREPVTSFLKITDRQNINMEEKIGQNFLTSRNFIIGKAYLADQNVKEAVSYFKKALAMDPNDRRSLHYKQKLLMYWGNI